MLGKLICAIFGHYWLKYSQSADLIYLQCKRCKDFAACGDPDWKPREEPGSWFKGLSPTEQARVARAWGTGCGADGSAYTHRCSKCGKPHRSIRAYHNGWKCPACDKQGVWT